MAEADSAITFICGYCEHVLTAPATAEGRGGRCPHCKNVIFVPGVSSAEPVAAASSLNLDIEEPVHRRQFDGLGRGVVTSLVVHVIVMSVLAVVYLKSHDLGRSIMVTLFLDTEGTQFELDNVPIEMPAPSPAESEGDFAVASDLLAVPNDFGDHLIRVATGNGRGGNRETRVSQSTRTEGSIDPLARFSPEVMDRLARQPAAKQGDYEIALFWNGYSDLDLHVHYETNSGNIKRQINYSHKGTPETGYLDVDQNFVTYVDDPIEHIRWNTKTLPPGKYKILVHGYTMRSQDNNPPKVVRFTVEVKTPEGIRSFTGHARQGHLSDITTLEIAGSNAVFDVAEVQKKQGEDADRLLDIAISKLEMNDPLAKRVGRGQLKMIIRKFPKTEAARQARDLLE